MESQSTNKLGKIKYFTNIIKGKKIILSVTVVALIAVAGYFIFGSAKNASGNFLTDTTKKATITSTISAAGMVEPVSTISMSFKNSEVVKKIYVKVGDLVTPGQIMAELYSENLEAQVIQSSASLKSALSKYDLMKNGARQEDIEQSASSVRIAQIAFDLAKSGMERNQKLYQAGALSQADLDIASSNSASTEAKLNQAQETLKSLQAGNRVEDIAAAEATVESSQAQLQMVESDLGGAKMYSPIEGVVSAINGAEGQRATANNNNTSGTSGFIVVISEELQIRAQVNEADIGKAQLGQAVEFTVNSFPNMTFSGKIGSISPQAYTVSNVQIYDVIIQTGKNYQELKAGMPSNVNIIVSRHENTLAIPKGAVTFAVSYLNKMKQAGTPLAEENGANSGGNNSNQSNQGSQRQGANRTPGGGNNNGSGSAGDNQATPQGQAKESTSGQQAMVMVMDKTEKPVIRRVTLGLSDLRNYEVLNGLSDGDTIVVGSLSQPTSTSTQGSQSTNSPFAQRTGGIGR